MKEKRSVKSRTSAQKSNSKVNYKWLDKLNICNQIIRFIKINNNTINKKRKIKIIHLSLMNYK